jgi:acetoacetate decarboxylase
MNQISPNSTSRTGGLTKDDILRRANAIPLCNPAYPPAPDKFFDRPALTVSYLSDLDTIRALVPQPLVVDGASR